MIVAFALAAAVLFGCGAYLLLKRDLVRVVAGIMLISQCALVTIIGSSLARGQAAIRVQPGDVVSDPLPQALALTARTPRSFAIAAGIGEHADENLVRMQRAQDGAAAAPPAAGYEMLLGQP